MDVTDGASQHGEAPEDDVDFLNLVAPVQGVTLKLSEQPIELPPTPASGNNLLALSNTFGFLIAANSSGKFDAAPSCSSSTAGQARLLSRSVNPGLGSILPDSQVGTSAPVDTLRYGKSDKVVIAGLRDASIGVWSLKDLVSGNKSPIHVFPAAGSALLDVRPCPAPSSPLVALLMPEAIGFVNVDTRQPVSSFSNSQLGSPTSLCWSVKGKQIAVGFSSGSIAQYTPEGEQKALIGPPAALTSSGEQYAVRAIDWLENNVFLVTYGKPRDSQSGEPVHSDEVFVITKAAEGSVKAQQFLDPAPAFGMTSRDGKRWTARFKGWSPFKHLLFMANAPSGDVGVLAQFESDDHWASLALPDASRPSLPLGPDGGDVCPLGLELDLSSTEPTKISGTDGETLNGPPAPAVYVYTSEGILVVWRIRNDQSQQCPAMRTSFDVLTQEDQAGLDSTSTSAAPATTEMAITPAVEDSAKPNPFGPPASSPFVTGAPTTLNAFGTAAPGDAPKFGSTSFGSAAFGQSSFGQSSFGAAAKTSPAPAFGGASGGGFSAFGTTKPAAATPATTASAGGFSAFGAGGAVGGFGSVSASTASSSPTVSAFGSGGTFGSGMAFGKSAFGSTPAGSAFEQAAKPAGETPKSSVPVGGFGGFGSAAVKQAAMPSPSGFAGFGSAAAAVPSGFGAFAGAKAGTNIFATSGNASTASAFASVQTSSSPFGSTSSAFGSGKTYAPSGTVARNGDDSDEEDDMTHDNDQEQGRVDEPPDLEPTQTNLDIGASMAKAKSSTEAVASRPTFSTSAFGASGTLGFGSLDFGSAAKSPTTTTTSTPPTTVFGSAATTLAPPSASVGFGFGGGSPLKPATGFSSFATSASKPEDSSTKPALSFATTGFKPGVDTTEPTPTEASANSVANEAPAKPVFSFATPASKSNEPQAKPTGSTSASVETEANPAIAATTSVNAPTSLIAGTPFEEAKESDKAKLAETGDTPAAQISATDESQPPAADTSRSFDADAAVKASPTGSVLEATPVITATPQEDAPASMPADTRPRDAEKPKDESQGPSLATDVDKDATASAAAEKPAIKQEPADIAGPATRSGSSTKSWFGFSSSPPASPQAPSLLSRLGPPIDAEKGDEGSDEDEDEDVDENEDRNEDEGATYDYEGDSQENEDEYDEEDDRYDDEEYDEERDEDDDDEEHEEQEVGEHGGEDRNVEDAGRGKSETIDQDAQVKPSLLSRFSAPPPQQSVPAKEATTLAPSSKALPFSFAPSTTAPATSASKPVKAEPVFGFASTKPAMSAPSALTSAPAFSFATPLSTPAESTKAAPTFGFGSSIAPAEVSKPAPAFGGFASAAKPIAAEPGMAAPSFGFGSATAKTSSSVAPGTGAVSTTQPASTPFSFASPVATSAPAAATVPAPKPTFSFASTSHAGTTAATTSDLSAPRKLGFSFASQNQSAAPSPRATPSTSLATPQTTSTAVQSRPPQSDTPRAPISTASAPRLGQQLTHVSQPTVDEKGMAGEFLKAFLRVQEDFAILKSNAKSIKSFIEEIGQPFQVDAQPVNFDAKYWSMGDLKRLQEETTKVEPEVEHSLNLAAAQKRTVAELQSQMLKAETKREEALRFLRARSDPEFAKMVRVRQLGPEQVENQRQIRLAMESVQSRLDELEDHLDTLKEKVVADRLGKSSFKAPSLDSVNRAIRNITVAVTDKTFEIDELAVRLDLMRVKLDSPARNGSVARKAKLREAIVDDALGSSVFRASPLSKARPNGHPGVIATASAALQAERTAAILKKSILERQAAPIVNKMACEPRSASKPLALDESMSDLRAVFATGPITGDRLPFPRRPPPDRLETVEDTPSTAPIDASDLTMRSQPSATALTSAPSPQPLLNGFGAASAQSPASFAPSSSNLERSTPQTPPPLTFKAPISFSFANPVVPPPAPSSLGAGSSRNRGGSSRTHSSAVQLRPSSTLPSSSPLSGSGPKGAPTSLSFSFGDLPSAAKREVAGFQPISLSREHFDAGKTENAKSLVGDEDDEGLESVSEGDEEEDAD
ncbi:hypothetical protein OIV83_004597 [Microbotryomycetes sp. JL201]|nr:hypothetical protein OIV83_004597 [Microbotryomycetes sp. JL201]